MLPSVLFLRQEWYVVCQRVRRVHQFLIREFWVLDFFGLFDFFFVSCAHGEC